MGLTRSALSHGRPLIRSPEFAGHHGHRHFWQRALSRRAAIAAGGLTLAGFASGRAGRTLAQDATGATAKPISGGIDFGGIFLHVYDYLPGNQPSTVGDFRGLVAINHLQGEGTVTRGGGGGGLSTPTASGDRLVYDADMRIMKGVYIGEDGQEHEGTFGFV
jgi:hypothetical protein